jgi:uncharacterized RDD family membrane protein YckC
MASGLYEALVLAALILIATFPYLAVFGDSTSGWKRHVLQAWVLIVAGAYFTWFWTRGGQTLAMKTWRIRLVRWDGGTVGVGRALHRYAIAVIGTVALGLGFLWALVDRDRQFLHDRLAGTALVGSDAGASASRPSPAGTTPPSPR